MDETLQGMVGAAIFFGLLLGILAVYDRVDDGCWQWDQEYKNITYDINYSCIELEKHISLGLKTVKVTKLAFCGVDSIEEYTYNIYFLQNDLREQYQKQCLNQDAKEVKDER